MAEYYFDYQIHAQKDELKIDNENDRPKLYFEQDYMRNNPPYNMYLVIPQWCKTKSEDDDRGIAYCTLSYDFNGTDIDAIDRAEQNLKVWNKAHPREADLPNDKKEGFDKQGVEMVAVKITRKNYKYNTLNENINEREPAYYRFSIVPPNQDSDYSGVGKLCLYGSNDEETIFLIMVNFTFKKKINYEIKGKKIYFNADKVNIEKPPYIHIETEDSDRYPCLKKDIRSDRKTNIKFDKKGRSVVKQKNRGKVYVSLDSHKDNDDETIDFNKYFYLNSLGNSTVLKKNDKYPLNPDIKFCPYCHRAMPKQFEYKDGGVDCRGNVHDKIKLMVKGNGRIANESAKKRIYCEKDCTDTKDKLNRFFQRLLPDDFMESEHYKIIVVGSTRCGKTVFLSRLFGVSNPDIKDNHSSMTMDSMALRNALNKCDPDGKIQLENYYITSVESKQNDSYYYCEEKNWLDTANNSGRKHFNKYVIDIANGVFPGATETTDDKEEENPLRFPFILKLTGAQDNKKKYIYFYDIAGEDAQNNPGIMQNLIGTGDNGESPRVGILYLVNGIKDSANNKKVADSLMRTLPNGKTQNYPIAVLLTKFDTLEKNFDTGCQCLRSDVYSMVGLNNFEESDLALNIDLASEEIRTYLNDSNIDPGFNKEAGEKLNVKYFGVSSFANSDALYHEEQRGDKKEDNYLKFASATKRIEVPVIWMFRQLGII